MNWSEYNKERIDNINDQVHITQVLEHYGIKILTRDREFQYPCPLHGDGQDNSYSARMYPDTNSTYCFACHASRDTVQWVRDYEGLTFGKALSFIERTFGVKNIPKPQIDFEDGEAEKEILNLLKFQEEAPSFLDMIEATSRKATRIVREAHSKIDWQEGVRVFFVLDNLRYDVQHGNIAKERFSNVLRKVYNKVQEWEAL